MSSKSLVTGVASLGAIGSSQPGHTTIGNASVAPVFISRSPDDSADYQLIRFGGEEVSGPNDGYFVAHTGRPSRFEITFGGEGCHFRLSRKTALTKRRIFS